MKTGLKSKIVSLIAATACTFTFAAGTLPFASAAENKWNAIGSNPGNIVINENGSVADITTDGDHMTSGAQLTNKFAPVKTGKYVFTFNLKEEIAGDGHWGSISFTWDAAGAGAGSATLINNGLRFSIDLGSTGMPQIAVDNGDAASNGAGFVRIGNPVPFKYDTVNRVVIETINGTSTVYINNTKVGDFTSTQGYYATEGVIPSLAVGGGGKMHIVIDSAPVDTKASLEALLAASNELYNSTAAGTDVGQAPEAAKTAFKAAIDAAAAKANGNEAELIAAVNALTNAKSTFESNIVSSDPKKALKEAVAAAEAILPKLAETSEDYKALNTLITEAKAIIDDAAAAQEDIDAKAAAVSSKVAEIQNSTVLWNVENIHTDPATGATVKSDKNTVTIKTTTKDGKLYTWQHAKITGKVKATNKLVFDMSETVRVGSTWSNLYIYQTVGAHNLTGPAYRVVFGDHNTGSIEEFFTMDANSPDAAKNRTIAKFSFDKNNPAQFSFEKTEKGKLLIKVQGFTVFEGDSELVDIFNGENDITLGYADGVGPKAADAPEGTPDPEMEYVITFDPETKFSFAQKEFSAVGQGGTGTTDKVTIEKNDKVQSVIFGDAMGFVDGIAKTTVAGPNINFSMKIDTQGENDWMTILFTHGIDVHAANTAGLAIQIGGDLSVRTAQYGQSGIGGTPIWTSNTEFFTQVGLKMIFNISVEDDTLIIKVNDTVLHEEPMNAELKAILESDNIDMLVYGASELGSRYDFSYINEKDPEPFDVPKEPEEPEIVPEIISLDDSRVLVNGTDISILEDMSVYEFLGCITFDESFTAVLLDKNGNEITDEDASALSIAVLNLMRGDEAAATFSINGGSIDPNAPQTGVANYAAVALILLVGAAFVMFAMKKKSVQ